MKPNLILSMFCLATIAFGLFHCVCANSAELSLPESAASTLQTNRPATFELKPTPVAPTGAKGSVRLDPGSMILHLSQLGPGVYIVQVVRRSDGGRQKLGMIAIADPTASPSRVANDNKKEASANPESVKVETDSTLSLPAALNPRDIDRVLLLDRGGNAVLDSKHK